MYWFARQAIACYAINGSLGLDVSVYWDNWRGISSSWQEENFPCDQMTTFAKFQIIC